MNVINNPIALKAYYSTLVPIVTPAVVANKVKVLHYLGIDSTILNVRVGDGQARGYGYDYGDGHGDGYAEGSGEAYGDGCGGGYADGSGVVLGT
jgi:hypothetical protein